MKRWIRVGSWALLGTVLAVTLRAQGASAPGQGGREASASDREPRDVVSSTGPQVGRAKCGYRVNTADVAPVSQATETSFEEAKPGPLRELVNEVGTWRAAPGHAEIDPNHARSGSQCLHILGGERRQVELGPRSMAKPGELTFWAERWTRRAPFEFRVDVRRDGRWTEIHAGDAEVTIGGFNTRVRIPLGGEPFSRLRFRCTSPTASGILIDDLRLAPATPQRVTRVAVVPTTLPALVGVAAAPLELVRVDVEGTTRPISLTTVAAEVPVGGAMLSSLQLFGRGATRALRAWRGPDAFEGAPRLGDSAKPTGKLRFRGSIELQPGPNYFWLAGVLKPGADLDGRIEACVTKLGFSDKREFAPTRSLGTGGSRLGVALRRQGDDGIHTARIPGLVTTNKGTLIAVYDLRHRGSGDLPGHIDVGMSRSRDGGRTWEPMRTIMDMGDDPAWRGEGIGDPAVLVDRVTNTIWVAAVWSHGNRGWFGSGPGLQPEETGQFMLVKSTDDGKTWSAPINITSQIKQRDWCFLLQGPGKGITMRDGTLVFPAQYQDTLANKRLPRSTIIYSRDRGRTWTIGTGAFDDTTESQVVETEPGVLMLNCRYNRGNQRVVMVTRDLGQTWKPHATSLKALVEPRSCMASLIDSSPWSDESPRGLLLFSNPNSASVRECITIKGSPDRGLTWPRANQVLLDEGQGAGYSCLTMIDEKTVGILYEGSLAHLVFQRVPLQDLLKTR